MKRRATGWQGMREDFQEEVARMQRELARRRGQWCGADDRIYSALNGAGEALELLVTELRKISDPERMGY